MKRILGLALGMSLLVGCGKEAVVESTPPALRVGDPLKAKYSWIAVNVFATSCVGCHNNKKPAGKLDLTTPAGVLKKVTPGDAAASVLFKEVDSGKMPLKKPKLADDQILAIYDWIQAGAVID